MNIKKHEKLKQSIDSHLRTIARQMVKFDSVEETLQYIVQAFIRRFSCDYVSIILKKDDQFELMAEHGHSDKINTQLPIDFNSCSPRFYNEGLAHYSIFSEQEKCSIFHILHSAGYPTWFTVPIKETDSACIGFIIIAYENNVPLVFDGEKLFLEFSKDIASSIEMAIQKEKDKNKMTGVEWLKDNLFLGLSLSELIKNIVERAGSGTDSEFTCIYLYNEKNKSFIFHPPSFGRMISSKKIQINDDLPLFRYFPSFEKEGQEEISLPLNVNLRNIGIFYAKKRCGVFSKEDKELLQFLCSYFSVLIENTKMFEIEMKEKARLKKFFIKQQELVQQTLTGEGFQGITNTLSAIFNRTVILFDRFFQPISKRVVNIPELTVDHIFESSKLKSKIQASKESYEQFIVNQEGIEFSFWKVYGDGELLGYLGIHLKKNELHPLSQMILNYSVNIFAIQFIKQKLVLDAKEHVKDSFFNLLFSENIEDKKKVIQLSSISNLNLREANQLGLIFIGMNPANNDLEQDILVQETAKNRILDFIRENVIRIDPDLSVGRKDDYVVLIAPERVLKTKSGYWEEIYKYVEKLAKSQQDVNVYLGISQTAKTISDYYSRYKQAVQVIKVLERNNISHNGLLTYENIGPYAVLNNIQDPYSAKIFVNHYLGSLIQYEEDKNTDLLDTLRAYVNLRGNLKDTAEHLFIHRNTLKYRIQRIREILNMDIDDGSNFFNFVLAFMLYDLYVVKEK